MPASPSPWDRDAFGENPDKNRHKDVYCFEQTRIELEDGGPSYIHANDVHLPGDCLRYALTQAPMRDTVLDFWRLAWQLKPLAVVALCQPFRDEERCLPNIGKDVKFGKFEISRDAEVDSSDWWTTVECTVTLTEEEDEEASEVASFTMRYMMWYEWDQDADIPPPDRMLAWVQELHLQTEQEAQKEDRSKEAKTDILLVCSTGAIRSGLVAAASALVRAISDETYNIDQIDRIVREIRECRHRTIDRFSQYAYLHWFALETIRRTPDLTLPTHARPNLIAASEKARVLFMKANRDEKLAALR